MSKTSAHLSSGMWLDATLGTKMPDMTQLERRKQRLSIFEHCTNANAICNAGGGADRWTQFERPVFALPILTLYLASIFSAVASFRLTQTMHAPFLMRRYAAFLF